MESGELQVFNEIFAVVRQIPHGKVATYGQVGKLAGGYSGRVAGFAMASLRWHNEGDVPWHRVINRLGKLSLRSFDGGMQRSLLEEEGVQFDARATIDLMKFQWDGN